MRLMANAVKPVEEEFKFQEESVCLEKLVHQVA